MVHQIQDNNADRVAKLIKNLVLISHTVRVPACMEHMQQNISLIKLPQQPVIKILTYPPPPQTGGIAITSEDLACLNEGEFLNDAIIDFYLKYVFYEKLSDYDREKTHIFSSYFYPRLTHRPERRPGSSDDGQKTIQFKRHSQVKTWTRHVDIFSKDYIIIPVNQNVHWFLAIICFPGRVPDAPPNVPAKSDAKVSKSADNVTSTDDQDDSLKTATKDGEVEGNSQTQDENSTNSSNNSLYEVEEPPDSEEPIPEAPDSSTHPDGNNGSRRLETPCICIFDSLSGPNRWRIAATLREYLEMEWKMKKGTRKIFDRNTMQGYIMRCPQQTNFHDCGVYLLQYVENFFQNPIPFFGNPMPDLSNWFTEEKVYKKRQQLKELILNLQKKQLANSAANAKKPNQLEIVPASPVTVQQTDNR
ncbi:sentrin-specific protease 6-like [Stegodyphus dumicola]|uniref:sentrin-specific protease 6-like n=1 Tax=Stegodyphus dumicola TaxID=202533 RepID=UPI0015B063D3|nr:sentrin-specific protease 6-like [Stegodyphus dumicola]